MMSHKPSCILEGHMEKASQLEMDNEHLQYDQRPLPRKTAEVEIAIVGGGLGGLALALALQERGIKAHVFEKNNTLHSHAASAIGIGGGNIPQTAICIGASGIKALDGIQAGLSKAMQEAGTYVSCIKTNVVDKKGEVRSREQRFEEGEYFSIPLKQAQLVLASLVSKDLIHYSHKLLRFESTEVGVDAFFEVTNEKTNFVEHIEIVHAKLLVGADGIWSSIRKILIGDCPQYLHYVDWNAYIPNPIHKLFGGCNDHEVILQHDEYGETRSWLFDAGKGYALWILRKLDISRDLANTLPRQEGGLSVPGSKARALQQLDGLDGWDDLKMVIQATDEACIFERPLMDRLPIKRWSDIHRRVLLIGDAAHALYVGPGQGARAAFEDAHQLSILLKESLSSLEGDNIHATITKFEDLRTTRMAKMRCFEMEATNLSPLTPKWVTNLSHKEKLKRMREYQEWIHSYPEKIHGDPDSTYWK